MNASPRKALGDGFAPFPRIAIPFPQTSGEQPPAADSSSLESGRGPLVNLWDLSLLFFLVLFHLLCIVFAALFAEAIWGAL